jgi:hypothetical protein
LNADHCQSLLCAFVQDRQGFVVLRQCGGSSILGCNNESIFPPAKFRCLLIGDGSLLVECGTLLLARGHHIELVVTTNDSIVDWVREIGTELVAPGRSLVDCLAGRTFNWVQDVQLSIQHR